MPIDPATITRLKKLLGKVEAAPTMMGRVEADHELMCELRPVLPALLEAATQGMRDTARIDWLESLDAPVLSQYGQLSTWQISNAGKLTKGTFLRDAIDSARDAARTGKAHEWDASAGPNCHQFCKRCFSTRTPENEARECRAGKGEHAEK